MNLPYGMRFNINGFEDRFSKMARSMELKNQTGGDLVDHLFELNEKIGLPVRLRDIGVKQEHIEPLADLAIADFAHPNNPKPVSKEEFKQLYLEAL